MKMKVMKGKNICIKNIHEKLHETTLGLARVRVMSCKFPMLYAFCAGSLQVLKIKNYFLCF